MTVAFTLPTALGRNSTFAGEHNTVYPDTDLECCAREFHRMLQTDAQCYIK